MSFAAPAAATAADSIYWGNFASGKIRIGNLNGSGTPADLFPTTESSPSGVAIDPAAGKIYWASNISGKIRAGNLNGSGTPADLFPTTESEPYGLAVDPTAGRIYWANNSNGKIRVGNLNGGGTPTDLFTESIPQGVVINPAAEKIYWAASGKIRVGNLNGGGTPADLFPTHELGASGVAIDPGAGKIYWSNSGGSGKIRVGNLNGSGMPADLFPTTENGPGGVAIDPAAGKIYWPDSGSGKIRVGNLNGGGTPRDLFPTTESDPAFVALLRSPLALSRPRVSGGARVGASLSCTRGTWASDLLGAFLYRAPRSFSYRWVRDGMSVAGGPRRSYKATTAGNYRCRVSAANAAGPSSQASLPHPVKPGKPKITKTTINRARRSARFSFRSGGASEFKCALINLKNGKKHHKPKFSACSSPKIYQHLQPGDYAFEVRGRSSVGPGPAAKKGFTI